MSSALTVTDVQDALKHYAFSLLKRMSLRWPKTEVHALRQREQLIPYLTGRILSQADQQAQLDKLDGNALRLLKLACSEPAYELEALSTEARALGVCDFDGALRRLILRGLILAHWQPGDKRLDADRALEHNSRVLTAALGADLRWPDVSGHVLELEAVTGPVNDIHISDPCLIPRSLRALVKVVTRSPLSLTQKGFLTQASSEKLARELNLESQPLSVSLLFEFCYALKLLKPVEQRLQADQAALLWRRSLWDVLPHCLHIRLQMSAWPDDLRTEIEPVFPGGRSGFKEPGAADYLDLRIVLEALLRRLPQAGVERETWWSLESFIEQALKLDSALLMRVHRNIRCTNTPSLRGCHSGRDRALQRAAVAGFVVHSLFALGLVDWAVCGQERCPELDRQAYLQAVTAREWPDRSVVFRLTELGGALLFGRPLPSESRAGGLIVGPDFEILAETQQLSVNQVDFVSHFSRAIPGHANDPVRRFRIDKESVLEALSMGGDLDFWCAELEAWMGRRLPNNVARALKDWAKAAG